MTTTAVFRGVLVFLTGQRVRVHGWSMYPFLHPEERVLFDRLAYRAAGPRTGDVVLAKDPRDGRLLVKRIAAVPGDPTDTGELGPDQYFVVGDAPEFSTDSRHFGPLLRRDLIGRAWLVYWPPDRLRRLGPP